jgi:hypothetical protein
MLQGSSVAMIVSPVEPTQGVPMWRVHQALLFPTSVRKCRQRVREPWPYRVRAASAWNDTIKALEPVRCKDIHALGVGL